LEKKIVGKRTMTLRRRIEDNPTIWLLSLLLVGFLTGFAAYRTIIQVSGQATVSKEEYQRIKENVSRVSTLEQEIAELKAREGGKPSAHRLFLSSDVVEDRPKDTLTTVRLDKYFYVSSKWIGLSAEGYYKQRWQILDRDGVVDEESHPFIPKTGDDYWTWASFILNSDLHPPGKYRLRLFLNDQRFEDRELVVEGQ
jgi:hypothetical protein